ncbi:MAG TPA: TonB-dependent receptor [Caulobacteraceae bacterium]|jgi:TonB-dependent receptor|nr:TonB-dependent receptor [Caulobacteraceae bacterium]
MSAPTWADDAPAAPAGPTPPDVVVTAPRHEVKARAVQMRAPNIIEVQSAETIAKYPDFNAAEALGRMPGLSLSSDTGEGRFVQIRGIDANLDGATYGGVPLLNTNPGGTESGGGGRAVEFDTIPTGAIDGIIVTFTGLPDHEAEGLGGSIELSPRTAANIVAPFVDATLGGGYEPLHNHSGPFEGDIAVGARFGVGDHGLITPDGPAADNAPRVGFFSNPTPFSFVLSASEKEDRRAVDDIEESYLDDGVAPSTGISEYDLRRYNYHRTRFGYGGEFDFQPNEDHAWYLRGDVAGYTESVAKNFLLFKKMDDPVLGTDPANPNLYATTTTPMITSTDERETHTNQIYVIGGRDNFGNLLLDYHAAYSRATFVQDHNIGAKFNGPSHTPIDYDNLSNSTYPSFSFPNGINLNDPSIYSLSSLSNSQQNDVDEEYSAAINATLSLHLVNDSDRLKFGVEARLRDKTASEYDETYDVPPLSLAGLSGPALTYYNGHYTNGPQISIDAIRGLIGSGVAVLDPSSSGFNQGSFFTAREDIYAGYGQFTTEIGNWGLLAGVRVEATDATYGGFVPPPSDPSTLVLAHRNEDYINAFPTVQLRYNFTPRMVLRATYSTGIARPGFNQNTTATSVDETQDPVQITRGNPELKPTLGNNFDLSFEDYLPEGGIIQLGLFDKEFTNYIAPRIQHGVADPLAPPGETADVTTFLNIPTAYARGFQAAYHQKFINLPAPFDGLGIDANTTLVDSRILEYTADQSLTGKAEYGMLPGTSAVTANLAGFYEAYGFQTRLAAEYVSHSLFGLGGDKSLDTLQDDRLTLDFTSSYQFTPNWTVYFNVKNLLNTPLRYYEGSPDRPIQREFYDATYEAGVRLHF